MYKSPPTNKDVVVHCDASYHMAIQRPRCITEEAFSGHLVTDYIQTISQLFLAEGTLNISIINAQRGNLGKAHFSKSTQWNEIQSFKCSTNMLFWRTLWPRIKNTTLNSSQHVYLTHRFPLSPS